MKIYTKTGDLGETGLLGGSRVPKDDLRVAACGEVDELSALLGVVRTRVQTSKELSPLLGVIQRDLFALAARLADPSAKLTRRSGKATLGAGQIRHLERAIDVRARRLPPLAHFIFPGGASPGAYLHLARTVCRRAERAVVALHGKTPLAPRLLAYLNRLSDLLFILAREANQLAGAPEDRW